MFHRIFSFCLFYFIFLPIMVLLSSLSSFLWELVYVKFNVSLRSIWWGLVSSSIVASYQDGVWARITTLWFVAFHHVTLSMKFWLLYLWSYGVCDNTLISFFVRFWLVGCTIVAFVTTPLIRSLSFTIIKKRTQSHFIHSSWKK